MEAKVYVEPQVNFGLLSEYADKLRSLSELCIKYHRRKLILDVFFYLLIIALLAFGFLTAGVLDGIINVPNDSLFFGNSFWVIAAVSTILVSSCLFIIARIRRAETAYTLSLQNNLRSLYERLALQVRIYSQYAEHGGNDKYRAGELDLRLTDAEGALSLAEEALKVSLGRKAWKAFERRSMRRLEPIPVHEERR